MTGNLHVKRSDLPVSLTVGAQVLLIDADPDSLTELARMLAPVVDLAATNSGDAALESIEAGVQFDAPLARRMLVLADAAASLADARALGDARRFPARNPGLQACSDES